MPYADKEQARLNKMGYYSRLTPAGKARGLDHYNRRHAELRDFLNDYKMSKSCVDCGYREYPQALTFDHVRGVKCKDVCRCESISEARYEIEKCEVRCFNCHLIRHWQIPSYMISQTFDLFSDNPRTRKAERQRKKRAELYKFIAEYKIEKGCIVCKFRKHPAALQFDHVRGIKTYEIRQIGSLALVRYEIEKCDVKCANCHEVKTYHARLGIN